MDSAQRLAGQTNRLVVIYFWAPWCGVCKRMEAEVLSQPAVVAELTADYVAVKINADHFPSTARQYGVTALPTTVVITPQGQLVDSMRGRAEAAEYAARLNQVAAKVKQYRSALYAQMPAGGAIPAPASAPASAPTQMPPAMARPPVLGGNAQPNVVANRPAAVSAPGSRYSSVPPQQGQAASVAPIAQPSSALARASNTQMPNNYGYGTPTQMPTPTNQAATSATQPTSPPRAVAQAYPPSQPPATPVSLGMPPPALASAAPAYGSQSPTPVAQQPSSPPVGNPTAPSAAAAAKPPVPTINPPLALDGYCPVGLSEKQQWMLGDRRWGAVHRGRTYLFSGPEEQRRFFTDPDRYAPVISGNDIVLAAEQGQAVPGMRQHGVFYGNQVYLFSSESTLEKFAKNPTQYANQASVGARTGAYGGQLRQ